MGLGLMNSAYKVGMKRGSRIQVPLKSFKNFSEHENIEMLLFKFIVLSPQLL